MPVDALYRLPSWGVFLDCPFLGTDAGLFAALDPGRIDDPDGEGIDSVDEIFLTFALPGRDPQLMVTSLRFTEGSIAAALAAQERDWDEAERSMVREFRRRGADEAAAYLGRSVKDTLGIVTSMLLYLCVDEPDLTERPMPLLSGGRSYQADRTDVTVVDAGWRLGADLRSARARYEREAGEGSGRRVAPHLRRAHWHSYWRGAKSSPEDRWLSLRYLAPMAVGSSDELPAVTVVRDAG